MMDQYKDGNVNMTTSNGITTVEFYHPQSNSLPGRISKVNTSRFELFSADTSGLPINPSDPVTRIRFMLSILEEIDL